MNSWYSTVDTFYRLPKKWFIEMVSLTSTGAKQIYTDIYTYLHIQLEVTFTGFYTKSFE